MLHAARCKYRTQKSHQKSPSGHHRTTLSGYIFATTARIDNRKKNLLSSNISSRCSHNMVNFGLLAAEIVSLVWGTPSNLNGFLVTARHSSSRRQPNFAALNRGRHLYAAGRAAITLGIRLHSSFFFFPRLISAVADCMSTILPHMMWS